MTPRYARRRQCSGKYHRPGRVYQVLFYIFRTQDERSVRCKGFSHRENRSVDIPDMSRCKTHTQTGRAVRTYAVGFVHVQQYSVLVLQIQKGTYIALVAVHRKYAFRDYPYFTVRIPVLFYQQFQMVHVVVSETQKIGPAEAYTVYDTGMDQAVGQYQRAFSGQRW